MSYWISLVEPDRKHHEIDWDGVHCSWNYSDMLSALPCGYERDWQGKQAEDMIKPIEDSLTALKNNPEDYEKYEVDPDHDCGTIEGCQYILRTCLEGFKQYPKGIIILD